MTLQEVLDFLADRYDLTFDVNEAAFRAEMVEDVLGKPVAEKAIPKMYNVSLETVLRKILARVPSVSGATYIIRRDVVEITTEARARAEKVVRVSPVADLVLPIPNSFNQRVVLQAGSIFGAFGAQGFGGVNGVAGFNGFAGFGGGFNALGGFQGFGGGFNALGVG